MGSVLSLNYNRILCRLRSRHAQRAYQKRGHQPSISHLPRILKIARSSGFSQGMSIERRDRLATSADRMSALFAELENLAEKAVSSTEGLKIIRQILVAAADLTSDSSLELIFNQIPNSAATERSFLVGMKNSIGKLGRYVRAAGFLVAAARRSTLFRRIEVADVSSARMCVAPTVRSRGTLESALRRAMPHRSAANIEEAVKAFKLGSGAPLSKTESLFQKKLAHATTGGAIHAEVQLMFFYEQQQPNLVPRVICSSKSACFLCALFSKFQGQFHIRRAHGRLYTKWTLPKSRVLQSDRQKLQKYAAIMSAMNAEIGKTIECNLLQDRKRVDYPNESMLHLTRPWSASVQSSLSAVPPAVAHSAEPPEEVATQGPESHYAGVPGPEGRQAVDSTSNSSETCVSQPKGSMVPQRRAGATADTSILDDQAPQTRNSIQVYSPHLALREVCNGPQSSDDARRSTSVANRSVALRDMPVETVARAVRETSVEHPEGDQSPTAPFLEAALGNGTSQTLYQGSCARKQLVKGGPGWAVRTQALRLELCWDSPPSPAERDLDDHDDLKQPLPNAEETCWVSAMLLERAKPDALPVIDLDDDGIETGTPFALNAGSAGSSTPFYIAKGSEVLRIKYSYDII